MITLWHVPQSRSFRVLWFLHEAGLAHDLRLISFAGRALRDPAYLALSPAGRVPAAEIDGRAMFESGAILEYLCETRAPGLGRPPGHPERAGWLEWLHYGETIGQHLAQLTQQHIVLREDWMRSPTVMKLEAMRLGRVLQGLERAVAAQDWLLPGGFSAVDVQAGYGVILAQRFVSLEALPLVAAYAARLAARPAYRAALAADGPAEIYTRPFYPAPDPGPDAG
ncbi:MAG: glutathione S-transferase family protein [Gemmobacter sp.]